MIIQPYYFGCIGEAGHYLFDANHRTISYYRVPRMLSADGCFAPWWTQEEGIATHSHVAGFTIISFWDRSVDSRPGSSSTFYIPRHLEFDLALQAARRIFPDIFARFSFPIILGELPEAVRKDQNKPLWPPIEMSGIPW